MLTLPPAVRVFIATAPTDMRRSFDTLAEMTRQALKQDPLSGHLFVFYGRRRDRVKILVWDRSGYWLFYKRLEKGTFRFPDGSAGALEIEASELALILEGIDLSQAQRRERFTLRPQP